MKDDADSNSSVDFDSRIKDEPPESKTEMDAPEMSKPKGQTRPYNRNLLTNAERTFSFLEHQSLVDFVEADDEYIVSAGRDHDINVWDAIEGTHIRRLSGHNGPITGLHLYKLGHEPMDRIVITSSEDGTIRQWSLRRGEELRKFETDTLITCMGVINQVLAVTGNHKGYMDVRHLSTGELYSSILAHLDPIDAIAVEGYYACSATFDTPSCLKVWEIQFEQTICIYRLEGSLNIEFCSLAIWNTIVILGASHEQNLHVINFKTEERGVIDLERSTGSTQYVRVINGWILSCSRHKRDVILDVHRIDTYAHFGTFHCDMQHIFAIAAIESESSLKIVLGGSALATLNFDFILMQEITNSSKRIFMNEKYNLTDKKRSVYTLKNTEKDEYLQAEKSSESDDDSYEEACSNPYQNMFSQLHSVIQTVAENNMQNEENSKIKDKTLEKKNVFSVFQSQTESTKPTNIREKFSHISEETNIQRSRQFHREEPRVAIKKLEKLLDGNSTSGEIEKGMKSKGSYEAVKHQRDALGKQQIDMYENIFDTKNIDEGYEKIIKDVIDTVEVTGESNLYHTTKERKSSISNELKIENTGSLSERKVEDIDKKLKHSKSKCKKKQRDKTEKNKKTQKHKCKRCQIM